MKALQLFTDDSLEQGRQLSSHEILKFLEDFRLLHGKRIRTKAFPQHSLNPARGKERLDKWLPYLLSLSAPRILLAISFRIFLLDDCLTTFSEDLVKNRTIIKLSLSPSLLFFAYTLYATLYIAVKIFM